MIRKQEATGKTVDEARAKACALLGVQADDLNVSYEVLEMPQKTGFLGQNHPCQGVRERGRTRCSGSARRSPGSGGRGCSGAGDCPGSSRCPRGRACRTGGSTGCRG